MLKGELVKMKRKLGGRKAKWQEERMKLVDRSRQVDKVLEEELIINCLARRCLVGGIRLVFAGNDAF